MVKYRDAIDAYWKVNGVKSIKDNHLAILKSGIKAYEVGKGIPKMTKEDKDNRIYHSNSKIDDSYLPYIEGKDVKRYTLTWSGEYIKYGKNLAAMRTPELFIGPRILVRQIPTKSIYSIEGTYTDKHIINDLNSMIITNISKIEPLALLGIINSKLMTLWFLMRFDKFQRRLFPQFKVNELEQFPIPNLETSLQEKIVVLVKSIMTKEKTKENCESENAKIDELVMTAFGLNDQEKESVRKFEI